MSDGRKYDVYREEAERALAEPESEINTARAQVYATLALAAALHEPRLTGVPRTVS